MKEMQKTEFQQRNMRGLEKQEKDPLTKEQFRTLLGEDQAVRKLERVSEKNADDIFAEHFEEKVPKETLKSRIASTFRHGFRNKTVSSMKKGKRADSAAKKLEVVNHMRAEEQALIQRRKSDEALMEESMSGEYYNEMQERFAAPEAKEAFRNWYITDEDILDKSRTTMTDLANDEGTFRSTWGHILRNVKDKSHMRYRYGSDREFASNFAEKYEELCRLSSAEYFYNLKKNDGGMESVDRDSMTKIEAKIKTFKALKEHYEDRMKMISSPYYALLSRKDLAPYLNKDGEAKMEREVKDEALKQYIRLYKKCVENPFSKDKGTFENAANRIFKETSEEHMRRDVTLTDEKLFKVREARAFGEPMSEEEEKNLSVKDRLQLVYEDMIQKNRMDYPESDRQFVKTNPLMNLGMKFHSFENEEELQQLEERILDMKEQRSVYGVPIKEEDQKAITELIDRMMEVRRDYVARGNAARFCDHLSNGFDTDLKNPAFQDSEEAQKLLDYVLKDGLPDEIFFDFREYKTRYEQCFNEFYQMLHEKGYPLSKDRKYEKQIEEDNDQYVEPYRLVRENRLPQNANKNVGEEKVRYEFPTFTVNGTTFRSFGRIGLQRELEGKNITVEGDKEKELLTLMKQLEELGKRGVAITTGFQTEGGEKGLVGNAYTRKLNADIETVSARIRELLEN